MELGADIDALDGRNFSPSVVALQCWNEEVFIGLAQRGAKLNQKDIFGVHIIHRAAQFGSPKCFYTIADAARLGQLDGLPKDASHLGHDAWHCFRVCRSTDYVGPRADYSEELTAFEHMMNVVFNELQRIF